MRGGIDPARETRDDDESRLAKIARETLGDGQAGGGRVARADHGDCRRGERRKPAAHGEKRRGVIDRLQIARIFGFAERDEADSEPADSLQFSFGFFR